MNSITDILRSIIRVCLIVLAIIPIAPILMKIDLNGAQIAGGAVNLYFPYITIGAFIFRFVVEVMFVSWIVLAIIQPEYRPNFRKPLVLLMSACTLALLVADSFGIDPLRSFWSNFERMEGFVGWVHLYALFLVLSSFIKDKCELKPFVITLWSVAVVNALLGIAVDDGKIDTYIDGRGAGVIGNPIYLAIYMFMTGGIVAWWTSVEHSIRGRVSNFYVMCVSASIVLFGFAIALSGTRGTFMAVAAALLVAGIYMAIVGKEFPRVRKLSIVLVAIVVIFAGFLFGVRNSGWVEQNKFLERASSVFDLSGTIEARFNNWQIAAESIKQRPVFGWGQDNYVYPFAFNFNPEMSEQEAWFDRTHNLFLDWFVHAGFVGGILYISLIVTACVLIIRTYRISVPERALLFATIIGYAVHNFAVFDFLISSMLLVIVLSYISGVSGTEEIHSVSAVQIDTEKTSVFVGAGVVALGFASWFFVFSPLSANAKLVTGITSPDVVVRANALESVIGTGRTGKTEATEQFASVASQVLISPDLPDEVKVMFVNRAMAAVNAEIDRSPTNVRTLMFRATLQATGGALDQAIATLERMRELAPRRQDNLDQLAQIYMLRRAEGDIQKALEVSKLAYDLSPEDREAIYFYALALIYSGKSAEAEPLLQKVIELQESLTTRQSSDLFEAYKYVGNYSKLAEILEPIAEQKPDDITINVSLAAAYLQLGNRAKSIVVLERLLAHTSDESIKIELQALIAAIRAGKNPLIETE